MIYGWSPGIGDPTAVGWATVVAYLAASVLAAVAGRAAGFRRERREARFWWITAAALLFLAINKELDLQSAFTAIGKHVAMAQGWYDGRRQVQLVFIAAVLLSGGLAGLFMLHLARRSEMSVRLALAGLVFIGAFVVIRATSFHHIDHWLGTGPLELRWNWVLELGGIAIVAVAALSYARRRAQRSRRRSSVTS